ncbi:MAG: hypothetical protein Q8K75_05820 [Chlamydiales bacterium]|nr:hypothetical protein [Chlamydiales bacterium]
MASVYMGSNRLGMGVFLEPDLLLIPKHLIVPQSISAYSICGSNLAAVVQNLTVQYSNAQCCFCPTKVLHVEEDGLGADYCMIRLAEKLPCQVPQITWNPHHEQCLFAEVLESGMLKTSIVSPCYSGSSSMCSSQLNWTRPGSSGGIYLDRAGQLIGIHLGQSTGRCRGETGEERQMLWAKDINRNSAYLSTLDHAFNPLSPPYCVSVLPADPCMTPQKDVTGETQKDANGYYIKYSEKHMTNAQRSIELEVRRVVKDPRTRKLGICHIGRITYHLKLVDNGQELDNIHKSKHHYSSYDGNERAFYAGIANLCLQKMQDGVLPGDLPFTFKKCDFAARRIA